MGLSPFFAAIWVFIGVMGPFMVWCFYPLLKRFPVLASPKVVIPSVLGVSGAFAILYTTIWTVNNGVSYGYLHFLAGGGVLLVFYGLLGRKSGYTKTDSLVLGALAVYACDVLWQIPYDVANWSQGWLQFAIGLSSAGWEMMSIPLFFYFVGKAGGKFTLDGSSFGTGLLSFLFTLGLSVKPNANPYILVPIWAAFFLFFADASTPIKLDIKLDG